MPGSGAESGRCNALGYVDLRERTKASTGAAKRPGTFAHDLQDNPYLSFAAAFLLAVPATFASLFILLSGLAYPDSLSSFAAVLAAGVPMLPSALLVVRGLGQLQRWGGHGRPNAGGEKQLLVAISHSGSLTPVEAALATSLSVDEAEELLSRLADRGHLRVEGRDGVISYALPGSR